MVKAFSRGNYSFYIKQNHGSVMIHANDDGTFDTVSRLNGSKGKFDHIHPSRRQAIAYVGGFLAI